MRSVIAFAAVGSLALAAPAAAQTTDAPSSLAGVALTEFAWLAGDWESEPFPETLNETRWMPPRAGVMTGMMRLSKNGELLVQEFFVLRETSDGGIEMRLLHFDSELKLLDAEPYVLRLAEWDGTSARFLPVGESSLLWSEVVRTADGWKGESEIQTKNGTTRRIRNAYRRSG